MSVRQVEDGVRAQPDHVYVIPPNAVLTLERGVLRVARPAETGAPEGVEADPRAGSAHRRGPRQACARGRTSRPGERCLESGDRLHLPGTGSNPVSDARWTPALHAPDRGVSAPGPRVSERRFHLPPAAPRAAMSRSSNTPTPRSGSIARDIRLPPRRRRRGRARGHGQEARRAKAPGSSAPAVDSDGCRPSPIGMAPCQRSIRSCRRTGHAARASVRNRRQGSSRRSA